MVYNVFNMWPILVDQYFVENFCINHYRIYSSSFSFSCSIFTWLWYHGNTFLIEWVREYFSPLLYVLKDLRRAGIVSSLNVGSHQCGFSLLEVLFDSISFLIISLCRFPVSLLFSLGRFYVLGIGQFHLSYPSLLSYIHSIIIILFISIESVTV